MSNSARRGVNSIVMSTTPPHDTNVLWLDTHSSDTPELKIFWSGVWNNVRTIPDATFNEILAEKVSTADFNAEVDRLEGEIAAKANTSDVNATVDGINDRLNADSAAIQANSGSIESLRTTVSNLRVISQEIVESLEDVTNPNVSTIYLVWNEEEGQYDSYIYVEGTGDFSPLGGSEIPVINITNLNTGLNSYITPGLYNVVYTSQDGGDNVKVPYLMFVEYEDKEVSGQRVRAYYQTLYSREVIYVRSVPANASAEVIGQWTAWKIKSFAYQSDIQTEVTNRNSAIADSLATAKTYTDGEIVSLHRDVQEEIQDAQSELLPLIYAGL